jgi:hypothetical protein
MLGMLCPANIFQFIINYFCYRMLSQHDTVSQTHKPVFHIAFDTDDEINAIIQKHLKK